jgi:F0F1-type ATP synthase gamma subunit
MSSAPLRRIMQVKPKMSRTGVPPRPPEELPYRIELWSDDGQSSIQQVLARALNVQLARAIFKAAQSEHPQRRITLSDASRIIADSSGKA